MPVDTASINTRNLLIEKKIGFARYKFKHTPLPQLKSLLFELENVFSNEIKFTRQSRFRSPIDISLTSSLLYNFAYLKNITKESVIDYSYINLGFKSHFHQLEKITTGLSYKRPSVFCINDVENNNLDEKEKEKFILIMEHFLPTPSKYEYLSSLNY